MPAISLAKVWHFKWNTVEDKKKRRSNAPPFPVV